MNTNYTLNQNLFWMNDVYMYGEQLTSLILSMKFYDIKKVKKKHEKRYLKCILVKLEHKGSWHGTLSTIIENLDVPFT